MSDQHPIDRNDPRHPLVRELALGARDVLRLAVAAGIADPSNLDGLDELDALEAQRAEADRADARRAAGQ